MLLLDLTLLKERILAVCVWILTTSSVLWHLLGLSADNIKLLLLLQLLLKLEGASLILKDSLIQISSAVILGAVVQTIVHYHIALLISNHLNLLLSLAHYHSWWEVLISTAIKLTSQHKLLVLSSAALKTWNLGVGLDYLWLSRSFGSELRLALCKFLLTLDRWPVDTISNRLSTAAEYRERIQPGIVSKDLLPVLGSADIVDALKWLSKLIKILNSCFVFASQH